MQNVVNMELQQLLWSLDMRLVRGTLGKDDSPRRKRIKAIMRSSKTAEECLLKTCSYLYTEDLPATSNSANQPTNSLIVDNRQANDEFSDNDMGMSDLGVDQDLTLNQDIQNTDGLLVDNRNDPYKSVIDLRRSELVQVMEELRLAIRSGVLLAQHIRGRRRRRFGVFESSALKGDFGDKEATMQIRRMLNSATREQEFLFRGHIFAITTTGEEIETVEDDAPQRHLQRKERIKMLKAAVAKEAIAAAKASLSQPETKARVGTRRIAVPEPTTDEQKEKLRIAQENEQELRDLLAEGMPAEPHVLPNNFKLREFTPYVELLDKTARQISRLIPEFVSRVRAIRLLKDSQRLQQWHDGVGNALACTQCGKMSSDLENLFINAVCGHLTCAECRTESLRFRRCQVDMCHASAEDSRYRGARNILEQTNADTRYGSKVAKIIDLIRSLPNEDQVLMFIQFDDLMHQIVLALREEGISNYALTANSGRVAGNMVDDFQENRGPTKRKVLILNSANASAAGA